MKQPTVSRDQTLGILDADVNSIAEINGNKLVPVTGLWYACLNVTERGTTPIDNVSGGGHTSANWT